MPRELVLTRGARFSYKRRPIFILNSMIVETMIHRRVLRVAIAWAVLASAAFAQGPATPKGAAPPQLTEQTNAGSSEDDSPPPPPQILLTSQQKGERASTAGELASAPTAPSPTDLEVSFDVVNQVGPDSNALLAPDQVLHDEYWVDYQLLPARNFYIEADYLNWWTKGMDVPPLVTTGADAAGLILPNTTILFGNRDYMEDSHSGGRIRFGSDFGCWGCGGWELEYFGLEQERLGFSVGSNADGLPFLGRPFFNINPLDAVGAPDPPAREDAELVSGTRTGELLRGRVSVDLATSFVGAAARWKCSLGNNQGVLDIQDAGDSRYASNIDFSAGYRYFRLSEGLLIREDLTAVDLLNNNAETDIDIFDRFDTMNEFHGVELGVQCLTAHRDWTLAIAGRMSLGDIQQSVRIDGQTTNAGVGGLLAQTSNIGLHQRNVFGMVPELEARLSKQLTQHISVSAGYNFIYWSRVVRPGDQIDLDVNPELLPPPVDPITGPLRPAFAFRDSDYWAQGISLGLNVVW